MKKMMKISLVLALFAISSTAMAQFNSHNRMPMYWLLGGGEDNDGSYGGGGGSSMETITVYGRRFKFVPATDWSFISAEASWRNYYRRRRSFHYFQEHFNDYSNGHSYVKRRCDLDPNCSGADMDKILEIKRKLGAYGKWNDQYKSEFDSLF